MTAQPPSYREAVADVERHAGEGYDDVGGRHGGVAERGEDGAVGVVQEEEGGEVEVERGDVVRFRGGGKGDGDGVHGGDEGGRGEELHKDPAGAAREVEAGVGGRGLAHWVPCYEELDWGYL